MGHILFYGPTGSGKTNALKIILCFLQNHYRQNIYYILKVSAGSLRSKWVGASEEKFIHIINQWEKYRKPLGNLARLILLIDEIDSVGFKRADVIENQFSRAEPDAVNSLLTFIDRSSTLNITIVGTTNYMQHIDPAVMRAGRVGTQFFIQYPTEEEKKIFIETSLSDMEEKLKNKDFIVSYDNRVAIINIICAASTTYKEINNNIEYIKTMSFSLSDNNNQNLENILKQDDEYQKNINAKLKQYKKNGILISHDKVKTYIISKLHLSNNIKPTRRVDLKQCYLEED